MNVFIWLFIDLGNMMAGRTRKRKPVDRLSESPIFPRKRRDSSRSPVGRGGRRRNLDDSTGELDTKRAKYTHSYEDDEDEYEDDISTKDDFLSLSKDPTKSTKRTIAEAFATTDVEPVTNSATDSLLRQILARLELLKQQHKETERQIQYIIDESATNPDLFIIQQARISQTETEKNATLSGELMLNLRAISNLLQRE